jgi:hypothetical protein
MIRVALVLQGMPREHELAWIGSVALVLLIVVMVIIGSTARE